MNLYQFRAGTQTVNQRLTSIYYDLTNFRQYYVPTQLDNLFQVTIEVHNLLSISRLMISQSILLYDRIKFALIAYLYFSFQSLLSKTSDSSK